MVVDVNAVYVLLNRVAVVDVVFLVMIKVLGACSFLYSLRLKYVWIGSICFGNLVMLLEYNMV
jgi:hypothetical protein